MALVTLRIIDGPERGKIFDRVSTPITIGREEGNVVRLNDERISRFHLKIHENDSAVLMTDLDSTNGTRVNGEVTQLWELKPGDLISVGRSVLLVGSRDDIARRLKQIQAHADFAKRVPMGYLQDEFEEKEKSIVESLLSKNAQHHNETTTGMLEELIFQGLNPEDIDALHSLLPPELPQNLPPRQMAQLLEMLNYFYLRIRYLADSVLVDEKKERVTLAHEQWQNLLDMYDRIAKYMKSITEP